VFLRSPKSCSDLWSESGERELDLVEMTRDFYSSRDWELDLVELTREFYSSRAAHVTPV
jgi:hypothetical protein